MCLYPDEPANDESCDRADIVVVVDSSGSIGPDNWQVVLAFVEQLANNFDVGTDLVSDMS